MQPPRGLVYAAAMAAQPVTIPLKDGETVSGLWQAPAEPSVCLVLAHGAGAGMTHRAMAATADGLESLGVATLRYQFPYMEKGGRRPDPPPIAHAAVRAAVAEARRRAPGLPLFAGGRSFGGRMTSQAQAKAPLPDVRGLVFFAFPLHPAGKPATDRADHLSEVRPLRQLRVARQGGHRHRDEHDQRQDSERGDRCHPLERADDRAAGALFGCGFFGGRTGHQAQAIESRVRLDNRRGSPLSCRGRSYRAINPVLTIAR